MAATTCLFLITGECLTDDDIGPLSELIILGVHAWDSSSLGFDLNEELKIFVSSNPSPQSFNVDEKGESVIRVFSDNLCVAALINPGLFTLASQLEWLVQTPFANRHLIFAGRQSEELGDWLLKDSCVSPARLGHMLRSAPDASLPPDHKFTISCPMNAASAAWKSSAKQPLTEFRPHAAHADVDQATVPGAVQLAGFIAGKQCGLASVEQRLRPASTVGNIRIAKPTLYVFPAGLGDSCYLGVDGFGLLVNTGAGKTPAFWPFLAHLDRVDGLLLSHWDHDNLPGLLALLERLSSKTAGGPAPSLGCALLPCRPRSDDAVSPTGADSPTAAANGGPRPLEASIRREAGAAMRLFRSLGVPLEDVRRQGAPQPMTLYSKLGNGCLELYPLYPQADSKDFKDYVALLQSQAGKPWPQVKVGNSLLSASYAHSLCCVLVWRPTDPKLPWTRLLLPGCCHQLRVIEGLERIRGLDFLKLPEYSPAAAAAAGTHKAAPGAAPAKKAAPPTKPAAGAPAAAASGDHQAAVPATKKAPAADAGAKSAPASKKPASAAPAPPPPIVKKPVASAKAPAAATGSPKPSSAKASTTASVSVAAAKKEPLPAAKGPAKTPAASAAPAAAKKAQPTKKPAAEAPVKKPEDAEASGAQAEAVSSPAVAAAEATAVADSAEVEEIPLGDSEAALSAEGEHQEQQEAWGLNTNNTNSAEADSAELIEGDSHAADADDATGAEVQPLGLPPPPVAATAAAAAGKKAGGAASAGKAGGSAGASPAINYGPVHPLYFDLAYVPGHGERQLVDAEFFKRVRARHYVLSSCDPQVAVLDALLEGKAAWAEQEATLVPTHSNHLLSAWMTANAERLQQLRLAVAPSASNCRIKLQNEEDQVCIAYRVEF